MRFSATTRSGYARQALCIAFFQTSSKFDIFWRNVRLSILPQLMRCSGLQANKSHWDLCMSLECPWFLQRRQSGYYPHCQPRCLYELHDGKRLGRNFSHVGFEHKKVKRSEQEYCLCFNVPLNPNIHSILWGDFPGFTQATNFLLSYGWGNL